MSEESYVPQEVSEATTMALELHEKLYPTSIPQEEAQVEEPVAAPQDEAREEEESYKRRYEVLQGKYKNEVPRLAAENRELKQHLASIEEKQAAPVQQEIDTNNAKIEEILKNLNEYPDELVDNIRMLNKLEAQQAAREVVSPVMERLASEEETRQNEALQEKISYLDTSAPSWDKIWQTMSDLYAGNEPEDVKIVEFLMKPDPSGVYTNFELLHLYNEKHDEVRFGKICNMYEQTAVQPARSNQTRDALLAPSRSNSQPAPQSTENRTWTMAEFNQFQKDRRAGKYTDEQAEVIWEDIQNALAENRIRG